LSSSDFLVQNEDNTGRCTNNLVVKEGQDIMGSNCLKGASSKVIIDEALSAEG